LLTLVVDSWYYYNALTSGQKGVVAMQRILRGTLFALKFQTEAMA
jgi:hypothetical protein